MGNNVAEIAEGLPSAQTIKVHAQMCSELLKVVVGVSKIFPEIEAARPRCSSGIEALCLLNNSIVKAKSLLEHCSESSVFYLALTGEAILSRCKKSRNLLEQSLSQIENMVPVMLAAKISGIIADLRTAVFCLDPSEEEAGRVLRELLHRSSTVDSTEEATIAAIQTVSSRLHILSQKALLIEKRSVKKLLDKFGESEPSKKKILLFFLNLLNKYGKNIAKMEKVDTSSEPVNPFLLSASPYHLSADMELHVDFRSNAAQIDVLSRPVLPEEFICPLSLRLMYDPVVISSGQTYERMWIQRWFDEGNDTCPKTNIKLDHLSFTLNTSMKDLIKKWCLTHNVSVPDPKFQDTQLFNRPWETSSNSIASLSSSMNNLNLPMDFSSGDSQCNAVEDVKRLLKHNDESWPLISSGKFIRLILRFLKDAHEIRDVEAQMSGCLLFLEFVQKHGSSASRMKDDDYALLASFLDTEVSRQALSILQVLSFDQNCAHKIASSGALIGILNILDNQIQELLEPTLTILSNLSENGDIIGSFIAPSELIPKLIPLFEKSNLVRHCIAILKNTCGNEQARISIAEIDGCIASIAKLLERESREDQECAVSVLLSLCSQRVEFCQMVMDEGVIPGLVNVSINGNEKAKAMAMEMLRILKDECDSSMEESSMAEISVEPTNQRNDNNSPKPSGLFRKIFFKQSPLASKKKK